MVPFSLFPGTEVSKEREEGVGKRCVCVHVDVCVHVCVTESVHEPRLVPPSWQQSSVLPSWRGLVTLGPRGPSFIKSDSPGGLTHAQGRAGLITSRLAAWSS